MAGLDEAGRGPLAGPVVAAATIVAAAKPKTQNPKLKTILREIKDSKKLTPRKREEFYKILTKNPGIEWGTGKVPEKMIDKINILEATKLAMKRALKNLEKKLSVPVRTRIGISYDRINYQSLVDFLILDGNFEIDLDTPQKSIIKADEKVFSCAAASIIAKVSRDRIMERYHKKYPKYGFDKHKGYPTKLHLKKLEKYGFCKIHRKSFKPAAKNKKTKSKF